MEKLKADIVDLETQVAAKFPQEQQLLEKHLIAALTTVWATDGAVLDASDVDSVTKWAKFAVEIWSTAPK